MVVRDLCKHSKEAEGYGQRTGPLTAHEIRAFAETHRVEGGIDLAGFARAIERGTDQGLHPAPRGAQGRTREAPSSIFPRRAGLGACHLQWGDQGARHGAHEG